MPRAKRRITEPGSSSAPSADPRFPNESLRDRFNTTRFVPMHTRYLSRTFFTKSCIPSVEVITYYGLEKLVYCKDPVNITLCSEFFNNLVRVDDTTYSTRVCCRDLIITPSLLREHLGLLPSSCTFTCFPFGELPFGDPYSHITLDVMHLYFFDEERTPSVSQFSSTRLRVQDYILYRVIVNCILPLSTRDIAQMRPFHSFLLYAFIHRLDIDISLLMFSCIIYFSRIVTSGRVHMPYCHILTSLLAALDFDITTGNVKHLTEYDIIGHRQFALARMELDNNDVLSWKRGAQPEPVPRTDDEIPDMDTLLESCQALPAPPTPISIDDRLSRIEEAISGGFRQQQELQEVRHREMMQMMQHQHSEMMDMFRAWGMSHPPPPPPPSD